MKTFSLLRLSVSSYTSQMSFAQVFKGHSFTMCYVMYVILLNNNKGFQLFRKTQEKAMQPISFSKDECMIERKKKSSSL